MVAEANALDPDLVVLLGDYVIQSVLLGDFVEPAETAKKLAKLEARYGVYGVLGNHDWWHDGPAIRRELEEAGVVMLDNEATEIEIDGRALWIAGVADDMTQAPDPGGTLAAVPGDAPALVIAHDPAILPDVPERAVLTLAGHTHGGQVYLPGVGALVIPGRSPLRYAYGHIREFGRDLYVTAGVGTSILPVRFNMPPEIAVITLTGRDSAAR